MGIMKYDYIYYAHYTAKCLKMQASIAMMLLRGNKSAETTILDRRNAMGESKDLNRKPTNYDELPLVLDVEDVQRIMGISRTSAYELVHTPRFPAFRSGRLIKIIKEAFFEWMKKG